MSRSLKFLAAAIAFIAAVVGLAYDFGFFDDPFPNRNEEVLLAVIPEGIRQTCQRAQSLPERAHAAVTCSPRGVTRAEYTSFRGPENYRRYNRGLDSINELDGSCSKHSASKDIEDIYHWDHEVVGRKHCWSDAGVAYIEWTDDRYGILARASRADGNVSLLHEWWLHAGPDTP